MSILTVGTVAFDSIETPFGRAERILGGSGTYISLAAALTGAEARLVGVVGKDFPDEHLHMLAGRGVDIAGVQRDPRGDTFFWAGRYHYDLNTRDTLATHLNVLASFDPQVPEAYRDSRIVCLGNLDPSLQCRVLDQISGANGSGPELVIADTMNYWIEQTPEELRRMLSRVDVLVINDSEARELARDPNLIRAARSIREMGPATLVIKKGEHGALLFHDGDIFVAPAFPLEDIHDPTGAGDAFLGGFAGHLAAVGHASPAEMRRAVVVGSALASFVVERFGVERLLAVTPQDLAQRQAAFYDLSAIPERATA